MFNKKMFVGLSLLLCAHSLVFCSQDLDSNEVKLILELGKKRWFKDAGEALRKRLDPKIAQLANRQKCFLLEDKFKALSEEYDKALIDFKRVYHANANQDEKNILNGLLAEIQVRFLSEVYDKLQSIDQPLLSSQVDEISIVSPLKLLKARNCINGINNFIDFQIKDIKANMFNLDSDKRSFEIATKDAEQAKNIFKLPLDLVHKKMSYFLGLTIAGGAALSALGYATYKKWFAKKEKLRNNL